MASHRESYLKTTLLAGGICITAVLAAVVLAVGPSGAAPLTVIAALLAITTGTIAVSGVLVLLRDRAESAGGDLFLRFNSSRDESLFGPDEAARWRGGAWHRRLIRLVSGQTFLVGDPVEVRAFDEIRATLDSRGTLDGLPFMPEMLPYCGRRFRVFRCVDKLYDYGGAKRVRHLRDTVLLAGLRCDGAAHGGCQAGCYLLWKTEWLKPVATQAAATRAQARPGEAPAGLEVGDARRYVCQYTEVVAASSPLHPWDIRQDLRPLLAGNVTLRAFAVAVLTRLFNRVQRWRGGNGYPFQSPGTAMQTPVSDLGLQPGDRATVRDKNEIAATLNPTGKNRGLWFDADMLKFCGCTYPVLRRVERIIDDASGRMIEMKTPCIVLENVFSSGETLRFCHQHDYAFWREAWLRRERG